LETLTPIEGPCDSEQRARRAPWWASGFSFARWAAVTPASGWRFTPGDFTGDGRTDLLGYHPSNGTLWVGVSSGTSLRGRRAQPGARVPALDGRDTERLARPRGEPSRLIGGSPYSPAQGASLRAER
jgi:hypothetical protein